MSAMTKFGIALTCACVFSFVLVAGHTIVTLKTHGSY